MKNEPKHRYQVRIEEAFSTETIIDTDDFSLAVVTYELTLRNTRYEGLPNKVELYDSEEDEVFFSNEETLSRYGRNMNDESI